MGTNAQTLLNEFATVVALLGGVVRLHSDHLMSGTFSLGFQDVEKSAPRGIHDGFSQVFNCDVMVPLGVLFRRLEVEITTLAGDLQMRFRHVLRGLTAAVTAFLATAHGALFASQSTLRGAIETRIWNRVALTIGQERLQSYINADVRMLTHP